MDPESGLAASILLAGHRVARVLEARLDANVSSGEAVLLGVLRDESLTMSGVMQALHIKASTATSLVSRLETAGLVSRSRNPADRRSFLVTITPAGEAGTQPEADGARQHEQRERHEAGEQRAVPVAAGGTQLEWNADIAGRASWSRQKSSPTTLRIPSEGHPDGVPAGASNRIAAHIRPTG